MESSPPIRVSQLRKSFFVTERESGVGAALASLVRRRREEVTAVDGISFTLQPGESRQIVLQGIAQPEGVSA